MADIHRRIGAVIRLASIIKLVPSDGAFMEVATLFFQSYVSFGRCEPF